MQLFLSKLNLQKKTFAVCLLISLIPVAILGIYCYKETNNLLIEREQSVLKNTLQQESQKFRSQLEQYESIMDYCYYNEDIVQALKHSHYTNCDMFIIYNDVFIPLFSTMKSLHTGIEDIIIYTDVAIYPKPGILQPLSEIEDLPWYQEVYIHYAPSWVFSAENESLTLVRQLYGVANNHTAILAIQLDYESTFSSLSTLFDRSYGILLTDETSTPIYQYQTEDISDSWIHSLLESETLPSPSISGSEFVHENTKYITEKASNIYNEYTLYLCRPRDTITEPLQVILRSIIIVVFACLVSVIVLSKVFSGIITRPIKMLSEKMHQVERGNYEITLNYNASDEIGYLIKTFQSMVTKIDLLINENLLSKIRTQELEIRALQSHISPHFLYNSLSLINSRAILNGQQEIAKMAQLLSSFYRTALNKGRNLITVRDEFENVRSYINIHLLMHPGAFDVVYKIDEDMLPITMINFLLQPLVENAIMHGIERRDTDILGHLEIQGQKSGDTLVFQITDNGPGIPEDMLSRILDKDTNGYGIKNVHNRIQLIYGTSYGLNYQSQLGVGTTVTLTIPSQLPESFQE